MAVYLPARVSPLPRPVADNVDLFVRVCSSIRNGSWQGYRSCQLTCRPFKAATTRWSLSWKRLQHQSGLISGLPCSIAHQAPENFSTTHPHRAVGIGDGHAGQLQQPVEINLRLFGQDNRMLQRTSQASSAAKACCRNGQARSTP